MKEFREQQANQNQFSQNQQDLINRLQQQLVVSSQQAQASQQEAEVSKASANESKQRADKNDKNSDLLAQMLDAGAIELNRDGSVSVSKDAVDLQFQGN